MSPLLHLLLLATTTITSPSTHPATIEPTNTITEGGTNVMAISYPTPHPPQYHPPRSARATDRIGQDASTGGLPRAGHGYPPLGTNTIANQGRSLTPTEHTQRPR